MSQISSAISVDNAVSSNLPSRFSEMATEDFIRIIFTELTNQDPLQPNDTSALLDQLNSIRSIESDLKLTEQLQSLVTENQLASASGMIGKFIGGRTADLERVTGFVVSVIKQGEEIVLELDSGLTVPIENVETVIDPSIFGEPEPPEQGESEGEEG
jgi:flagellar basal-body rod modification protein FlgD